VPATFLRDSISQFLSPEIPSQDKKNARNKGILSAQPSPTSSAYPETFGLVSSDRICRNRRDEIESRRNHQM
jgi:hypothetical protein